MNFKWVRSLQQINRVLTKISSIFISQVNYRRIINVEVPNAHWHTFQLNISTFASSFRSKSRGLLSYFNWCKISNAMYLPFKICATHLDNQSTTNRKKKPKNISAVMNLISKISIKVHKLQHWIEIYIKNKNCSKFLYIFVTYRVQLTPQSWVQFNL